VPFSLSTQFGGTPPRRRIPSVGQGLACLFALAYHALVGRVIIAANRLIAPAIRRWLDLAHCHLSGRMARSKTAICFSKLRQQRSRNTINAQMPLGQFLRSLPDLAVAILANDQAGSSRCRAVGC
jgi:hypothetical protein